MHEKLIQNPFFNFGKEPKTAIACNKFLYKSDILNKDYHRASEKLTLNRMLSVCHSYVLVCHSYVTRMSSVCHLPVVLP